MLATFKESYLRRILMESYTKPRKTGAILSPLFYERIENLRKRSKPLCCG